MKLHCVLRAPFDGEIAKRLIDPGAFIKPGTPILFLVDRSTIRIAVDVPEVDFNIVAPTTHVSIYLLATQQNRAATITRRSPSADASTRTIHFEIDVADPQKQMPVGTTAEIKIEVGEPTPTLEIPLTAAAVRNAKANIFVVENTIARAYAIPIKGEQQGSLYIEPHIPEGALLVTEGRALLQNGDKVSASIESLPSIHSSTEVVR